MSTFENDFEWGKYEGMKTARRNWPNPYPDSSPSISSIRGRLPTDKKLFEEGFCTGYTLEKLGLPPRPRDIYRLYAIVPAFSPAYGQSETDVLVCTVCDHCVSNTDALYERAREEFRDVIKTKSVLFADGRYCALCAYEKP